MSLLFFVAMFVFFAVLMLDVMRLGVAFFRRRRESYYSRLFHLVNAGCAMCCCALAASGVVTMSGACGLFVVLTFFSYRVFYTRVRDERREISEEKRARPYKVLEASSYPGAGEPCWTGRWVATPDEAIREGYVCRYDP